VFNGEKLNFIVYLGVGVHIRSSIIKSTITRNMADIRHVLVAILLKKNMAAPLAVNMADVV